MRVIIPVLNEEATIAPVIQSLRQYGLTDILVVDNGSSDRSIAKAQEAGAEVIREPIPGYGRACWRGITALEPETEWVFFCDGDGSDDLSQLPELLAATTKADFVLGDRRSTAAGRAAMTPVQNFGNWLATFLIGLGWGHRYRDLGPLRLIRRSALEQLQMEDRGFGWTVEMQAKAVEAGLAICEIPVGYRRRQGGRSKISGTLSGSFKAGTIILGTLGKLYLRRLGQGDLGTEGQGDLGTGGPEDRETGGDNSQLPLLWLSGLLILLGCLWIIPHGYFPKVSAVPQFWRGIGIMSLGFVASWGLRAVSKVWFWAIAILSRALLLPMYPGDDIWRYLWEGHLQNLGISPYRFAPDAAELVPYHTEWWHLVNNPDTSAIYPPLTQWGFRAIAAIATSVLLFKLAFVLADLLVCWLLGRSYGYQKALLYAWNPLIIYSFAGGAHYDSWFILPLVVSWLAFEQRRWTWSALALGASIAIKWMSLPILVFLAALSFLDRTGLTHLLNNWELGIGNWASGTPLLGGVGGGWHRASENRSNTSPKEVFIRYFQQPATILVLGSLPLLLTAIPFCNTNECPLIPTGSVFVSHGRSAELFPHLLGLIWQPSKEANWIYSIPLACVIIGLFWREVKRSENPSGRFLYFAESYFIALLILSPIIHAWYFAWIVPFAAATRNLGTRLVSISAFVYFMLQYRWALEIKDWYLPPLERTIMWLPFVLGILWTWDKGRRGQGDKGTRRQGDKGTRGQGDKGTRRQGDKGTRGQGDKGIVR
ncbi:MAG: glycosyltransferase [Oscillatoria sp. SIO1A7]|nr:glycosyltransferase [Oscillatoria sp. SIO1A7]